MHIYSECSSFEKKMKFKLFASEILCSPLKLFTYFVWISIFGSFDMILFPCMYSRFQFQFPLTWIMHIHAMNSQITPSRSMCDDEGAHCRRSKSIYHWIIVISFCWYRIESISNVMTKEMERTKGKGEMKTKKHTRDVRALFRRMHTFSQHHDSRNDEGRNWTTTKSWREHTDARIQTHNAHRIYFSNMPSGLAGRQAGRVSTNDIRTATKTIYVLPTPNRFVASTSDDRVSFYVHLNKTYLKEITDLIPFCVRSSPFFHSLFYFIFSLWTVFVCYTALGMCCIHYVCVHGLSAFELYICSNFFPFILYPDLWACLFHRIFIPTAFCFHICYDEWVSLCSVWFLGKEFSFSFTISS